MYKRQALDPLVSLGISALIFYWAWGILKESSLILLEFAPAGLDVELIESDLKRTFPEIAGLFNSHLWTITPSMLVFSAHMKVAPTMDATALPNFLARINTHLAEQYHIIESTLQLAAEEEREVCNV